jgi:hypothetical protein
MNTYKGYNIAMAQRADTRLFRRSLRKHRAKLSRKIDASIGLMDDLCDIVVDYVCWNRHMVDALERIHDHNPGNPRLGIHLWWHRLHGMHENHPLDTASCVITNGIYKQLIVCSVTSLWNLLRDRDTSPATSEVYDYILDCVLKEMKS